MFIRQYWSSQNFIPELVKLRLLQKKFRIFFRLFLSSPMSFSFPRRCKILVYDAEQNFDILKKSFDDFEAKPIFLRGEEPNFWCLAAVIWRRKFWLDNSVRIYAEQFIRFQKPQLVISFIDNNPQFFQLKEKFPHISFVAVQNGFRHEAEEFFTQIQHIPRPRCDYIFSFGSVSADLYEKYIDCSIISHGSLKANEVFNDLDKSMPCNGVVFVSEFSVQSENSDNVLSGFSNVSVPWSDFYRPDILLIPIIAEWCQRNSLELVIAGNRRVDDPTSIDEKLFYERFNFPCQWSFAPRLDFASSYKLVGGAKIVVGLTSTLLYESLGVGKRTAFFLGRDYGGFKFGAHLSNVNESNSGEFWTDKIERYEIYRVLNFLVSISDLDWESHRSAFGDKLMNFDSGNSMLREVIQKLVSDNHFPI